VYLATIAPGLTFEHHGVDGGDLIAAARTGGIPHPSGYPTYTLLAWFFTQLPLGTVAFRTNLLSSICAAGAVAFVFLCVEDLLPDHWHRPYLAAAAAFTVAFSPLLWSQAVITEVYGLLALFASVLLWLIGRWRVGKSDAYLWVSALLLGLGLGNHVTLVMAVPGALLALASQRARLRRMRTLLPALGLFTLGLCIYAYLPFAASRDPAVNWGDPRVWDRFVWVVTAKQYQPLAFGLSPELAPGRLSEWARMAGDQFGWWGLALALAGGIAWWKRDRRLLLFWLIWASLIGVYAFFYDTIDSHVYLLPVVIATGLLWALGSHHLIVSLRQRREIYGRITLGALVLLPALSLVGHWSDMNLRTDRDVPDYLEELLDTATPGALIVVRGDRPTFALWYALFAEERRPDLAVVSGPLLAYTWYRNNTRRLYPHIHLPEPTAQGTTIDDMVHLLVSANVALRPVFATDPSEAWLRWYDFTPIGNARFFMVTER
jgi:hypothetical protein